MLLLLSISLLGPLGDVGVEASPHTDLGRLEAWRAPSGPPPWRLEPGAHALRATVEAPRALARLRVDGAWRLYLDDQLITQGEAPGAEIPLGCAAPPCALLVTLRGASAVALSFEAPPTTPGIRPDPEPLPEPAAPSSTRLHPIMAAAEPYLGEPLVTLLDARRVEALGGWVEARHDQALCVGAAEGLPRLEGRLEGWRVIERVARTGAPRRGPAQIGDCLYLRRVERYTAALLGDHVSVAPGAGVRAWTLELIAPPDLRIYSHARGAEGPDRRFEGAALSYRWRGGEGDAVTYSRFGDWGRLAEAMRGQPVAAWGARLARPTRPDGEALRLWAPRRVEPPCLATLQALTEATPPAAAIWSPFEEGAPWSGG